MDICELVNNANWKQPRHPWERSRVKVVANLLKPLFADKKGKLHILDIGSGDAYMAYQLVRKFPEIHFHCVDIEYSELNKDQISKALGGSPISLYASIDAYKGKNPGVRPDVILLLDVIEHIDDDVAFLKGLADCGVIGRDTQLLITVPAFQSLFSAHDIFLKHYRRYTVPHLEQTLKSTGFEKVKSGYFFLSLLSARYMQKRLNLKNNEKDQVGISSYRPVFLLDSLFEGILLVDYYTLKMLRVVGIRLPGLSCFAICRLEKE